NFDGAGLKPAELLVPSNARRDRAAHSRVWCAASRCGALAAPEPRARQSSATERTSNGRRKTDSLNRMKSDGPRPVQAAVMFMLRDEVVSPQRPVSIRLTIVLKAATSSADVKVQ